MGDKLSPVPGYSRLGEVVVEGRHFEATVAVGDEALHQAPAVVAVIRPRLQEAGLCLALVARRADLRNYRERYFPGPLYFLCGYPTEKE